MSTLRDVVQPRFNPLRAVALPATRTTVTYAQLRDQITTVCESMKAQGGLSSGDVVSLALPNTFGLLVTFLGLTWEGAIAAPLNPAYSKQEFKFYMEDMKARAVIVAPGDHPARHAAQEMGLPVWELNAACEYGQAQIQCTPIRRATSETPQRRPVSAEDIALFLHTSGTTSRPKGVPLRHRNIVTSMKNITQTYNLNTDDSTLCVMPLFHIHGIVSAMLSTLFSGGTIVLPPKFSASTFWSDILEYDVTWFTAVPTIHKVLLARADKDNAPRGVLRFIRSCSSALAPAVMHRLEERFGAPVLQAYAMTEAAHQMTSNNLPPGVRKPESVGCGQGVEVTCLDLENKELPAGEIGEISIRGANVMDGYLNNPEANAVAFTNGWFRTGDQGYLDKDGFVVLTGRLKELINRGGEKISPVEIDEVMLQHPAVNEAVSFGVPDAKYGEEVHAAVVLQGKATEKDILDHCKKVLAPFKVPKVLYIADTVPRTATGKIQRRHVATHFFKPPPTSKL